MSKSLVSFYPLLFVTPDMFHNVIFHISYEREVKLSPIFSQFKPFLNCLMIFTLRLFL